MKSSVVFSGTFLRFETMIWRSIMPGLIYRTLKAFTHFLTQKKRENVLKNVGCKKEKLWAIFLPRVHLEKVANTWKPVYICKVFYMTVRMFRNTSLSILVFVNNNCCLCKCFAELYFLSWLLVVSFAIFKNRNAVCFQSYMNIACRGTQNAPLIKRV